MAVEITDELVAHVARLARVGISAEEVRELKVHFQKVLEFVKVLDGLDLENVDPSSFPFSASNVFRSDEVSPSLPVEESMRNAPLSRDSFFLVPRIIAEAGSAPVEEPEGFS